jgi:predicted RNA-binding Zn-ribbon protein involved in translation (DUF1610 family)
MKCIRCGTELKDEDWSSMGDWYCPKCGLVGEFLIDEDGNRFYSKNGKVIKVPYRCLLVMGDIEL